jgi:hypothetical protein
MSWFGIVNEKTKNVELIMVAGENRGYLTNIKTITVDDSTPQGRGPGATAIKKTKHIVCNDIENDSRHGSISKRIGPLMTVQ